MATASEKTVTSIDRDNLRATVEALGAIDRPASSPGEREAAEWIAARLQELGCDVRVEEEQTQGGYAGPIAALCALGVAAGLAALTRRGRLLGGVAGAAAAAAIADDASNGPRLVRGAMQQRRPTWNVVAQAGDRDAEGTLVVLAHHDAAPTGRIFDQTLQHAFAEAFPGIVERMDTAIPVWWPVVGGPGLVALGAARRSRRLAAAGAVLSASSAASFIDIARSPTVPGANDNLTAVAVLVAVARALNERPLQGLRVLLVSCGSEETLQGGIRPFARRHFPSLDRERTSVLNLDTVGSPRLVMLEGEGPLVMEDYHDRTFRDLVAQAASDARVRMRRGMRARASTDSVIPSRAGYPTATLTSVDRAKALSNYHQMTDLPENVDYGTVAEAAVVTERVARALAAEARR